MLGLQRFLELFFVHTIPGIDMYVWQNHSFELTVKKTETNSLETYPTALTTLATRTFRSRLRVPIYLVGYKVGRILPTQYSKIVGGNLLMAEKQHFKR